MVLLDLLGARDSNGTYFVSFLYVHCLYMNSSTYVLFKCSLFSLCFFKMPFSGYFLSLYILCKFLCPYVLSALTLYVFFKRPNKVMFFLFMSFYNVHFKFSSSLCLSSLCLSPLCPFIVFLSF